MGRRIITEFFATALFITVIGCVVVGAHAAIIPVAIGFGLFACISWSAGVSGAHLNPAATLGFLITKNMKLNEAIGYWVAQILGGFAGAGLAYGITGQTFAPMPGPGVSTTQALLAEVTFTTILVLVILSVAVAPWKSKTALPGLPISSIVIAGAAGVGSISGAAFNPAVSIGPSILNNMINKGTMDMMWITIVGPFLGALAAVAIYTLQGGPAQPSDDAA